MGNKVRIGIDVGGTFTDAVVIDNSSYEVIAKAKIPTTHHAEKGVAEGIVQVIRKVLAEAGNPRAFYLGDTDGDERAARLAGIPFVHAAYGFGRAERPDAVLERFSDLPALAAELFSSPLFG